MSTENKPLASFRYVGDTTSTKEGGIIVLATHRDTEAGQVHVGVALTKPGMRYDKHFMRSVALFRLRRQLADIAEDLELLKEADEHLRLDLLSIQPRVKKTCKVTRLSLDQYLAERAKHPNASQEAPANLGYYLTESTYFQVEDFLHNVEQYTFTVEADEDAGHMDIDQTIFEHMLFEATYTYPKWARNLLAEALEHIDEVRSDAEDEEEFTIAGHNDSFTDLQVVNNIVQDTWYLAKDATDPVSEALTPAFPSREELVKYIDGLSKFVIDVPEFESKNTSLTEPDIDDEDMEGCLESDGDEDDDLDSTFDADEDSEETEDTDK